jgi:hypothetical protein
MTMEVTRPSSFGRTLLLATTLDEAIALEQRAGLDQNAADVDAAVELFLSRLIRGERIANVKIGDGIPDSMQLVAFEATRATLADQFTVVAQQRRGAWSMPEEAKLRAGLLNLPHYFRIHPKFAHGIAADETVKLRFSESSDAVLTWSVLEPLCEGILAPFELRGPLLGKYDHEEERAAWTAATRFMLELGFHLTPEFDVLRDGRRWALMHGREQIQAKVELLNALTDQLDGTQAVRYRVASIRKLLEGYYQRSAKGPALKRRVISSKPLERILSGFFGGDWLAFLEYAGEKPHPDERVAQALPSPRLFVGGRSRVADVAAAQGLSVDAVQQMLASFWGGDQASPVDRRIDTMRAYWSTFDEVHAQQRPGMPTLWGMNQESGLAALGPVGGAPYDPADAMRVLAPDVVSSIRELWGSTMLPNWPERIVTEPVPLRAMVEAFGPAIALWQGAALTAWYICEGPMSRTDLPGLGHYQRRERAALDELGCGVDPALYDELAAAGSKLGRPMPVGETPQKIAGPDGLSFVVTYSFGTRRDGFEILRDTITRYRRAWAAQYLETYLHARWESELREASRQYHKVFEQSGRPPAARRFARPAATVTNHWFGGDIRDLYGAIGEKCPIAPTRVQLLKDDPSNFIRNVFAALNDSTRLYEGPLPDQQVIDTVLTESQRDVQLRRLAEECVRVVQLGEALGHPPEVIDFGASTFVSMSGVLGGDLESAWSRYRDTVYLVLSAQMGG